MPRRFIKQTQNGPVVSQGAFNNTTGTDEMSVSLGDTLESLGRDPESVVEGMTDMGLVSLSAGFVRNDEEQTVERSPNEEDEAHGDVVGEKKGSRRKRFANQAVWVVVPGGS